VPDIAYTPTFRHVNWVDNVDRITAGGPNGFNVRFDAIDRDLQQASTLVTAIDAAIGQPAGGSPGQQTLTVPLNGSPGVSITAQGVWRCDNNGAFHPGSTNARTVIFVQLPEQIRLVSMRMLGLFPGGAAKITMSLFRIATVGASPVKDLVAQVTETTPGMTSPYDVTIAVNSAFALVNPMQFRYYLDLNTQGAPSPFTSTNLSAVQLNYTAA
jgi:hypothetical protein